MQLTLLTTTQGTAGTQAGVLGPEAWRALTEADRVLAADPAPGSSAVLDGVEVDRVVWLLEEAAAAGVAAELEAAGHGVTVLPAACGAPGARFLELVAVMDRLRRECPWDREQTPRTLARYLLEETHETLEAIETGDAEHLQEELGDLLLQVVFHARIAEESGSFDVDDVTRGITEKLVHRHPHVFAGLEVADAEEVDRNWEALKAVEKQRSSLLDGVPATLPALAYADKVLGRLARAGRPAEPEAGGGIGDALLALVVAARAEGLDAEQELRDAVRRLLSR